MIEFNHTDLARKLTRISDRFYPFFAAMVAERLFPHAVEFFGKKDTQVLNHLRLALDQIWACSAIYGGNNSEQKAALAVCLAAIQTASSVAQSGDLYPMTGVQRRAAEAGGTTSLRLCDISACDGDKAVAFFAENATAAILYGLRTVVSKDPNDAAWSAQRAYDTVDRFVLMQERDLGLKLSEDQILAHAVIQQELHQQLSDINALVRFHDLIDQDKDSLIKFRQAAQQQAQSIFTTTPLHPPGITKYEIMESDTNI
jgi:hypothetical protein